MFWKLFTSKKKIECSLFHQNWKRFFKLKWVLNNNANLFAQSTNLLFPGQTYCRFPSFLLQKKKKIYELNSTNGWSQYPPIKIPCFLCKINIFLLFSPRSLSMDWETKLQYGNRIIRGPEKMRHFTHFVNVSYATFLFLSPFWNLSEKNFIPSFGS